MEILAAWGHTELLISIQIFVSGTGAAPHHDALANLARIDQIGCRVCAGKGSIVGTPCPMCWGTGRARNVDGD